ncbi:LysR family transcriptional regulator [Novosphingobium sp.]|uniref:LysR family transcriptional regulator n=1 Tax=Novosphingobium sp. TaxID=1874826 RepID=UPI002FDC7BB6
MIDLNDLRIFERVAALGSFSKAAQALAMPKSTVSRCVARLEEALGIRLLQRTTRDVVVTEAGRLLHERSNTLLSNIDETMDLVGRLVGEPRGLLCVSAGIGFGINILSEILPKFRHRYPLVEVSLDLTSREAELVQERIDVAIRMGPIADSSLIATKLGSLPRYMCASPRYLEHRGTPQAPADLSSHDCIEMPGRDGRARTWTMMRGDETAEITLTPKISINDALTIHNLVRRDAGIGVISAYLCGPDFEAGRLVRVLPDWSMPPVEVSIVFPSRRELSPTVRAFVDFVRETAIPGAGWQADIGSEARAVPPDRAPAVDGTGD